MKSRIACLAVSLVVAGCGAGAPAPSQSPSTPTPIAAAPVASPTPSEPPSQPTPASPVAAPEPTVQIPLHPVIKGAEHVWKLGDTLMLSYGSSIALIQNGKFEKRDDLSRQLGAQFFHPLEAVYGRWPEMVFAEMIGTDGRSGWSELYAMRDGKPFRAVAGARLPTHWRFVGISPWARGSWLALEVNTMPWGPPPHVRFRSVRGPTSKLPVLPPSTPTEECPVAFSPTNMIAFESGEVFVTGTGCDGEAILLKWPAGQTTAQVTKFPGTRQVPWGEGTLVGRNASDVVATWTGRERALAMQHDGTNWAPLALPYQGPASLRMDGDGTLWQLTPEGTFRRQGDAWARVAPLRFEGKDVQIDEVFPGAQGELWATAGGVLWHSEKPTEQLITLEYEPGQEQRGTISIPRAADWACNDIFVLMYGMTKVTPKNYDYPLTRKALKGHTEFASAEFAETEDGGRHYFGAFVQELDLARKMASIVESKVPGSKPQVLCVKPRVVRRLKIDMRTGDVLANEPVNP